MFHPFLAKSYGVGEKIEEKKKVEKRHDVPPVLKFRKVVILTLGWNIVYLKRGYKKEGDRSFSRACCDKTKGNGFKLKEDRFSWL